MKIVYFGTPEISADILEALIGTKNEIAAIVTQPDRAKGRSGKPVFSPVKEVAVKNGIPVLQPEKARDSLFMDGLEKLGADVFIVAAYGELIPARILEMTKYGCINVHPSLLPKYRGAAPIPGAILNGDSVSGVTIMKMAETMDTGDILLQKEIVLDPKETVRSLEKKSAKLAALMLPEVLEGLEKGILVPIKQDDSKSTYIKQFSKDAGHIDFEKSAEEIERMTRAYDPWPSAYTYLQGKTFKIFSCDVIPADESRDAGEVISADKKQLVIACGKGALSLKEVQLEGKKRMGIEEFLRGKKIEAGTKFGI